LTNKQTHFEAHIDFKDNLKLDEINNILENIRKILLEEFHINHVTLQPEFNICDDKELVSQHARLYIYILSGTSIPSNFIDFFITVAVNQLSSTRKFATSGSIRFNIGVSW